MSNQDVRKEQIALLRFEKQLAEMADSLAALENVAASTDDKLGSNKAAKAHRRMKAALINLAETTSKAHDSLMNQTVKSNARMLDIDANILKPRVADVVSTKVPNADSNILKPVIREVVKEKLGATVDANILKPRVSTVVKGKLNETDANILKPRIGNVVKSKLTTS